MGSSAGQVQTTDDVRELNNRQSQIEYIMFVQESAQWFSSLHESHCVGDFGRRNYVCLGNRVN